MAFAGGWGIQVQLDRVPHQPEGFSGGLPAGLLFSESNTRWMCEVPGEKARDFERHFHGLPHAHVGQVVDQPQVRFTWQGEMILEGDIGELKAAWKAPIDW